MADLRKTLTQLFDIRMWAAFDVDAEGRVLAGNDDLGSLQLVEIAPDGTVTPLTDLPHRCSGQYLPGTRTVIVQHDNGGDEQMQLSTLDAASVTQPLKLDELTPLVHDPKYMHVLQEVTADSIIYSTTRRNGVDMDVVRRDMVTGDETVLYDGGGYAAGAAASHDGTSVATTALSLVANSTLLRIEGPLAKGDGAVTDPDEHALHSRVHWAAGDDALIVTSNHEREFSAVFRVSLDGSDWQVLVENADHDVVATPDRQGNAMVVGTLVDGALSLAVHEADGTHRCDVQLGEPGMASVVWAADGSRFVVTTNTPGDPGSIWSVDAQTGQATQVADGRGGIDAEVLDLLGAPSIHRIPTPDGYEIPCFRYEPAVKVPELEGAAVIHIHGGPEASADRIYNPTIHALRCAGFVVLVPNVRGSTGYGKTWYTLDDLDKRLDSVADLAAIHAWLPSAGLDRAALWGGSYGGYMVLAGVSMQPELWAAGVDIVGMSSLVTFMENTSTYRRAFREREYGSLENHRDLLEKASPITYLDQMKAPLFVIHGANDPRVPLSEAEQIKAALDGKGVDCDLRVYHDEGHGLAKRENRLDAYPAAIEFLTSHLGR